MTDPDSPSTNDGPNYATQTFANNPTRSTLPTGAGQDGSYSERSNFRTSVIHLDRPGDPSVFDAKTRAEAAQIVARYPTAQARSALLPMLHLVQSVQGQVTADGIAFCSDLLDLTKAQVAAVATFYTMYKRSPTGEYLVSVCTNTLCGMLGGDDILAALQSDLGVHHNQTSADGTITLEHAECLAACDYAPVVTVNYEFFDNQTVESARNLVTELRTGLRPQPTRGAPLGTFRQMQRQIAGFYDNESAIASTANGTGVPTERGVRLAIERGDTAPSYSTTGQHGGSDTAAASRSAGYGPSDSDAPLQTAESDSANSAQPATERRGNNEEN